MSDTESECSCHSDTVREGMDAKNVLKQRFMSYKCRDCNMIKLTMKQGFINDVVDNICQYTMCDNCSKVLKSIDAMDDRNIDIDIRSVKTLDEDLEIWTFVQMNEFLTRIEFDTLLTECDDEGNDNDFIFEYYNVVKRLYSMSFDIDDLYYDAMDNLKWEWLNLNELEYTVKKAITTMGYFKKEIGNNIYNEKTSDKIIKRIKKYFVNEIMV